MRLLSLVLVTLLSSVEAGFLRNFFAGTDKCRCEGQWTLDMDTWEEPNGNGGLKEMGRPIVMEVWPADDDTNSLRATITVANVIGIVVRPVGQTFCDKDVELAGGSFSTRMFAFGAAGTNEKKLGEMLLDGLEQWDCDKVQKTLTLTSPLAQVTFRKSNPVPIEVVE